MIAKAKYLSEYRENEHCSCCYGRGMKVNFGDRRSLGIEYIDCHQCGGTGSRKEQRIRHPNAKPDRGGLR